MPRWPVPVLVLAAACSQPEPPRPALTEAPTHERYTAALAEFGLDRTALGQDWLRAADAAVADPIPAALPFRETGYLPPDQPTAVGYRFDLDRGRRLVVDVTFEATEPTRLYIDLFELAEGRGPRLVASTAPDARQLDYEARRSGPHVLRVQPELLRGGRFTITERTRASLGFPVEGLSTLAVQSAFGDSRDAGRRAHHGVDIFAPRGTPVLAGIDGRVRTSTGDRGGKVIWLSPASGERRRLYYAHLDGWAVANGAAVRAGDVIGFVGNTGNARTTPPHLHFGVYDRGPVDPSPYLSPDDGDPWEAAGDATLLRDWVRTTVAGATLRVAASSRATARLGLELGAAARVVAMSGAFYRVVLPDGVSGYVAVRQVASARQPLEEARVDGTATVRDRPVLRAAVIETLGEPSTVEVLGRFGDYQLVRLPDARIGWMPAPNHAQ